MALERPLLGHRVVTLVMVVGTSFLLGYLGMPTPLHALASLGLALIGIGTVMALEIHSRRPGPPPTTGKSSAGAVG
ncbi:MAG TPA: hypothetical protein VH062_35885 [Polyangiaceae bacterium]|jgi:hypothetical protein|nr:hypothetical protein [Polyangiaceae bacterium]